MPEIITPQEILPHPLRGTMEIGSERIVPVFGNIRVTLPRTAGETTMPEIITPQEILPHPFDPEQRIIPLTVIRAEKRGSEDEPVIRFIATDGSEDRHGSRINPNGWDLSHFKRNPVILWCHNQQIPAIGKGEEILLQNGRMELDVRFALDAWDVPGMGNLAMLLYRLASQDFVRAMSTSFIPKAWHDIEAETIPSFFAENVSYDRQEMTENSIVNVPSNRNAMKKAVEARVISENEANLLGLGAMLRFESPVMVRTESGVIAPKDAVPPAEDRENDLTDFRERVSDILTRCCGCEPYYIEPAEPIDEETKAAEIATLNDIAASALESLDAAISGWKTCKHEELRSLCRDRLYGAIWMYDRAAYLLKEWYGEEIGVTVPDINFDDVERALEGADFNRAGAVLSSANMKRMMALRETLQSGADLCDEVISSAKKDDEGRDDPNAVTPGIEALRSAVMRRDATVMNLLVEELTHNGPLRQLLGATIPLIRIKTGDEAREQDSNATFRVLASDASGDRTEDRPAPGDLYRVMLRD